MRTLNTKNWYRPREIAQLGLIKNSTGGDNESSNYNYILELIRNGTLKAKNYATGPAKRPFWLVSEDEIRKYHETVTN